MIATRNHSMVVPAIIAGAIILGGLLRMPVRGDLVRVSHVAFAEWAAYLAVSGIVFVTANRWVGLLMVSAWASAIWCPSYDEVAVTGLWSWLLAGVFYAAVFSWAERDSILDAICAVSLFHMIFMALQYFDIAFIFAAERGASPSGMMSSCNEAGALHAIASFAFLRWRRPSLAIAGRTWTLPLPIWALWPIPVWGVWLAASSGAAIALVAGLGVFAWIKGHRWLVLGAIGLLGLFFAFRDVPEPSGLRLNCWMAAIDVIRQIPWFGLGTGHWPVAPFVFGPTGELLKIPDTGLTAKWIKDTGAVYWDTAHNDYIQVATEQGVKAVIIMAGYLFFAFRKTIKNLWNADAQLLAAMSATILVSSMFHWTFFNGATTLIGIAALAMLDKETSATI